jgi:DNA repair photolyase
MTAIYEPQGRAAEYAGLAINQYIGCVHGCRYCYAAALGKRLGVKTGEVRARAGVIESLKKQAPKLAGDKRRVLLSFLSDPYPPIEDELFLTREVMTILGVHGMGFQVLTKAAQRATEDFDLYTARDMFAVTLTFPDHRRSYEWEPMANNPLERIDALRIAHEFGIRTWASIEPVLDPAASLEVMDMAAPFVDLFKIGKVNHQKNETDWRAFGIASVELCRKLGKPYFIKNDLAAHLNGFEYASTDTRLVE